MGGGFKAQAVGKPERAFFEVCLQSLGVDTGGKGESNIRLGDVAVVGDDAEADLGGGAVELGLQRVLGERIRFSMCRLLSDLQQSKPENIGKETRTGQSFPQHGCMIQLGLL